MKSENMKSVSEVHNMVIGSPDDDAHEILKEWKRDIERAQSARTSDAWAKTIVERDEYERSLAALQQEYSALDHAHKNLHETYAALAQQHAKSGELAAIYRAEAGKEVEGLKMNLKLLSQRPAPANATPAPDQHNAKRLAWREYAVSSHTTAHAPDRISMADALLTAEEARFGEIK